VTPEHDMTIAMATEISDIVALVEATDAMPR
jgi:hypothetical protein